MRYLLFVLLVALSVPNASCRTAAGERISHTAADIVLPPEQEEQLGDQMAAQIASEMTLVEGTEVSEYVSRIGKKIVSKSPDKNAAIDFDFHVVKDESVNAFAIPGGDIYVTTGLLKAADSEAELAAVLAHEVSHVTQRHIARQLAVNVGVSTLANIALGSGASQLAQLVGGLAANGYLLKYSRDDEREADAVGMNLLVKSGYSPYGYVSFFEELSDSPQPPAILSSHPHPEERVTNARRAIARYRKSIVEQPAYEDRYSEITATL